MRDFAFDIPKGSRSSPCHPAEGRRIGHVLDAIPEVGGLRSWPGMNDEVVRLGRRVQLERCDVDRLLVGHDHVVAALEIGLGRNHEGCHSHLRRAAGLLQAEPFRRRRVMSAIQPRRRLASCISSGFPMRRPASQSPDVLPPSRAKDIVHERLAR
jgi:hypothetical protein